MDRLPLFLGESVQVRENICVRRDPALSRPTAPMTDFEIVLPISGFWVREIGRHSLPVGPGLVHFVPAGEVHRIRHPIGCGDRNTGIVLAAEVIDEIAAASDDAAACAFRARMRPMRDSEHAAHVALRRALQAADADPLALEEGALSVAAAVLLHRSDLSPPEVRRADTDRARQELVQRTIGILSARYSDRLSLSRVARLAATSPFHLARVFRGYTGLSVHGYLRRVRLMAALDLLLETDLSLASIATRTGFSDTPHLCRWVRALLGATPTVLRRARWHEALRMLHDAVRESN